jgi:putative hemolysin
MVCWTWRAALGWGGLLLSALLLGACAGPKPVAQDQVAAYCLQQGGEWVQQVLPAGTAYSCRLSGGTLINANGLYRLGHPQTQAP